MDIHEPDEHCPEENGQNGNVTAIEPGPAPGTAGGADSEGMVNEAVSASASSLNTDVESCSMSMKTTSTGNTIEHANVLNPTGSNAENNSTGNKVFPEGVPTADKSTILSDDVVSLSTANSSTKSDEANTLNDSTGCGMLSLIPTSNCTPITSVATTSAVSDHDSSGSNTLLSLVSITVNDNSHNSTYASVSKGTTKSSARTGADNASSCSTGTVGISSRSTCISSKSTGISSTNSKGGSSSLIKAADSVVDTKSTIGPMTSSSSENKVKPCLGQPYKLGSLFNTATKELTESDMSSKIPPTETIVDKVKIHVRHANEVVELLEIDALTELEIISDLVQLSGAAKYLEEAISSPKPDEVALLYKVVSKKASLSQSQLSTLADSSATHIVSSVELGVRVLFLFKWDWKKKPKYAPKLIDLVNKLPSIETIYSYTQGGSVRLSYQERDACYKISCRVFSDVDFNRKLPENFADCVGFYQSLTKIIPQSEHVAVRVWLQPLHSENSLQTIPVPLLTESKAILLKLQKFIIDCRDLIGTPAMVRLPQLRKKVSAFMILTSLFEDSKKAEIGNSLLQVQMSSCGYGLFENLLRDIDSSPFNVDVLAIWHKEQEELLKELSKVIKSPKRYRTAKVTQSGESRDLIAESKAEFVAVLRLGTTSEERQHLENMMDCLRTDGLPNLNGLEDLLTLYVYDGSATSLTEKVRDFINMADDKTCLILTDDASENGIGQIEVYKNGKIFYDDFVPPPKLRRPECADKGHDYITVFWKELDADCGVTNYEVAHKIYYETSWRNKTISGDINELKISGLKEGTNYMVKVRAVTKVGATAFSPVSESIITLPTGPPGKPMSWQVSEDGCVLKWSILTPRGSNKDVGIWEVETDGPDGKSYTSCGETKLSCHVEVKCGETYTFRVRYCGKIWSNEEKKKVDVKSQFSEYSEPVTINASLTQIVKNRALMGSTLVLKGSPSIYNLPLREEYTDPFTRLRKVSYGKENNVAPMKTVLVVGATGAGKSTLVNAFINYVMDVQWDDDFRFRLIQETINANQAKSQTKWVTAYVLYHQKSFLVPYSLTIIDTPGFGDTAGVAADKEITEQLSAYFHAKGHEGIDCLDAIGFVVQSALPRLTPTQRYIFDSILALFGKDIGENIFMLITFADGQKPPVLQGLKEAKMPYTHAFKFNNSAIFCQREGGLNADDSDDSDSDDGDDTFDKMFWDMGAASYKKFLTYLAKTQPKSLTLTNEVLDERQHLETHVTGIHKQIREGLSELEQLRAGLKCLSDHQADIDRNKDFEYEVNIEKTVKIDLERGRYVTNCLTCNRTCHYPCGIPKDQDKAGCAAMTRSNGDALCHVCTIKCHWSVHVNTPYRYELVNTTEKKTASELKAQYEAASHEKLTTEQVILKMVDDVEARELYTAYLTNEVRTSLDKLNLIALKPCHLTTVAYIDVLIQSERSQALPGYLQRIFQLEGVRERAETLTRVAKDAGVTQPWDKLREAIKQQHAQERNGFWNNFAVNIKNYYHRLSSSKSSGSKSSGPSSSSSYNSWF